MIDVNQPVTNPELVEAISEMRKNNTEATQAHVLECLLNAHFLAPIIFSPDTGDPDSSGCVTLHKGSQISFEILYKYDREPYFFAFSDWDELGKWQKKENQQTLIITFESFGKLAMDSENILGIVINPYGDFLSFRKDEISGVLGTQK